MNFCKCGEWNADTFREVVIKSHLKDFSMQNIQYNSDKTLVTVPYQEWLKLQNKLKTLQNKLKVFSSIQAGINEIKEAKKTGKDLEKLSDFINENRS